MYSVWIKDAYTGTPLVTASNNSIIYVQANYRVHPRQMGMINILAWRIRLFGFGLFDRGFGGSKCGILGPARGTRLDG